MSTKPVLDGSAPAWAQAYATDVERYIASLLSEIERLKARLKTAGIP